MKERLVKGTNVVGIVRLLRAHQREHPLPELGVWERDLLSKRVAPSTWYALGIFDSLLQIAHRFVFDGSEAAAQAMGRNFARETQEQRAAPDALKTSQPIEVLTVMAGRWRSLFNFGQLEVTPWPTPTSEHGVRVQVTGYPDMSACHGHAIIGWSMQLVEDAGAKEVALRVEERPWMHNSVLTYTLQWS